MNVLLSTLMGGMSGSANADAAMQSTVLVPEMTARGYDKAFSAAVTAFSAVITAIIPPSIGLILYGFLADVSIGRLFHRGAVARRADLLGDCSWPWAVSVAPAGIPRRGKGPHRGVSAGGRLPILAGDC